jgi:hypothetical protein
LTRGTGPIWARQPALLSRGRPKDAPLGRFAFPAPVQDRASDAEVEAT